jgi:uncharacterized integral membrane protein
MKLISWLITAALIFLAMAFALSNRQSVNVSMWPLNVAIQAPLFLLSLGTLFFGMLIGAVIGWLSSLPHRAQARRLRNDIASLHEQIEDLQRTSQPQRRREDQILLSGSGGRKWRFWGRGS